MQSACCCVICLTRVALVEPGEVVESNDQNPSVEETLASVRERIARVREGLAKTIVGQEDVVEQLLIALLAGGHCILVGVPGLAKTLLISTLARIIGLEFSRIQFTPDLMPADITGTEVIQEDKASGTREFRFIPGPIFANVILADEINRTPPKTQAALLEAMQERQVTSSGKRHALPDPFFVLATQNPIDQEGTYPLPEAQLDRFMLLIKVDYPSQADELAIVLQTTGEQLEPTTAEITGAQLAEIGSFVRKIAITPLLALTAIEIVRMTRPVTDAESHSGPGLELVNKCVRWGAGPRASQHIVLGAKARAAMYGRPVVSREDIDAVAIPVLRHRIKLNFQAEAEGMTVEDIIRAVLRTVDESIQKNSGSEQIAQLLGS